MNFRDPVFIIEKQNETHILRNVYKELASPSRYTRRDDLRQILRTLALMRYNTILLRTLYFFSEKCYCFTEFFFQKSNSIVEHQRSIIDSDTRNMKLLNRIDTKFFRIFLHEKTNILILLTSIIGSKMIFSRYFVRHILQIYNINECVNEKIRFQNNLILRREKILFCINQ